MKGKTSEFVERFIDACGTSEPAEIQRLLNLPYQTVRNYLGGRLPKAEKLLLISEQTSCSIDWLLTGQGTRWVESARRQHTPLPTGQMEAFVRRICVEILTEMTEQPKAAEPFSVKISSQKILSEKAVDRSSHLYPEPLLKADHDNR
jgi:CI repressor-like protein